MGFTLIEMTVSMAILSLILVAIASAVMLGTRAMNAVNSNAVTQTMQARAISEQIAADLKVALAFSERTSTAVTFTVPDRSGDGLPEQIRYAWAGASGALTRQYTSAGNTSIGTLATNIQNFDLNWLTRSVGPPAAPVNVESAEQLLIAHNGSAGTNIKTFSVTTTAWPSEYFKPTLPANAVSWKITRIKLMLARNGSSFGSLIVQVRGVDAQHKPVTTVSDTTNVSALTLSTTPGYVDVAFSNLAGLDPTQGYCVVVRTVASPSPATVSYDNASSDGGMSYTSTSDTGATWSTPVGGTALQYYVYGTYTTPE
jgi:prepilin-type N-terminal cleavage/methylation domain-containing protein